MAMGASEHALPLSLSVYILLLPCEQAQTNLLEVKRHMEEKRPVPAKAIPNKLAINMFNS